jgi:hypothetical protein
VGGATVGPYRKPGGGRMKWRVVLEVISARGVRPPTFWTVSCYKKAPFVSSGQGHQMGGPPPSEGVEVPLTKGVFSALSFYVPLSKTTPRWRNARFNPGPTNGHGQREDAMSRATARTCPCITSLASSCSPAVRPALAHSWSSAPVSGVDVPWPGQKSVLPQPGWQDCSSFPRPPV